MKIGIKKRKSKRYSFPTQFTSGNLDIIGVENSEPSVADSTFPGGKAIVIATYGTNTKQDELVARITINYNEAKNLRDKLNVLLS